MCLNQQCFRRFQSEKQYSHNQYKEITPGTGKFSTNFLFFSIVFCTSVGSICPQLCCSHISQLCQAAEGSMGPQPITQMSKPETIRSKGNIRAKPTNWFCSDINQPIINHTFETNYEDCPSLVGLNKNYSKNNNIISFLCTN